MANWRDTKQKKNLVEEIYKKDGYICHYCGKKVTSTTQIFHLITEEQNRIFALYDAGAMLYDEYLVQSDSEYLRKKITSEVLLATVDHIIPQEKGGTNDPENLTTACPRCNSKKGNRETPQKENGYTPIANQILDDLVKINLSPYETRMLMFIFRKTYGYGQKTDYIATSQFCKACDMDRRLVFRSLKKLVDRKLVISTDDKNKRHYGFQKDSKMWLSSLEMTKKVSSKQPTVVISTDDTRHLNSRQSDIQTDAYKRKKKLYKRNYTKEIAKVPEGTLTGQEWEELIDVWKPVDKFYTRFYRRKTDRGAIQEIVKKVGKKQYLMVIKMLPTTNKINYFPKVNTPCQLRDKWSALEDAWVRKKREIAGSDKVDTQQVDRFLTK